MYWITPDGSYYEGQHVAEGSIAVTQRPAENYSWDGEQWVIDIPKSAEMLIVDVDGWLDSTAQAYGYESIRTAVTYADEPADPIFQAEGQAFREWRSLVYRACYDYLAEVQQGLRPIPTWDELKPQLPQLAL